MARRGTEEQMSIGDLIRKGLGFLLMSMGVSSPEKKPSAKPAPKER
jgi:hypothetical protein